MATIASLAELEQRIAKQQAELEKLQREREIRRMSLTDLTSRKKELLAQLKNLDSEILAVTGGKPTSSAAAHRPAKTAMPVTSPKANVSSASTKSSAGPKLADVLLDILRQAGRPLPVKELAEALVERRFETRSQNIPGLVQTRVQELVAAGVMRRVEGQGYVIGKASHGKPVQSSKAVAPKPTTKPEKAKPTSTKSSQGAPSLRAVLIQLLKRGRRPMKAGELAEQVLKSGYQSESKDSNKLVGIVLASTSEFENVAGEGYRLKAGRS